MRQSHSTPRETETRMVWTPWRRVNPAATLMLARQSAAPFSQGQASGTRRGDHAIRALLFLGLAAFVGAPAFAQWECKAPSIIKPALNETVDEFRPIIRWASVPGASRYRVVLTARKPEGGVLASIDTSVDGGSFIPPVALAVTTAIVTLTVSAVCGNTSAAETPSAPTAHRFYISMQSTCRLPDVPRIETAQGRRHLNWTKAANADRYEVLAYAAFDGRLLFTHEAREPAFALPDSATGPLAIIVRPRCGPVDGAPAFVVN